MAARKSSEPIKSNRKKNVPSIVVDHGISYSNMSSYDKSALSPNLPRNNSFQKRSAIHTEYGRSPVSMSADNAMIKFDYNIFVTTWQDQIKMRQYKNCEKYCREVITKLLAAQDQRQLVNAFGFVNKAKSVPIPNDKSNASAVEDQDLHTLLEYRSKVHFSLAYLLKKYFKRYDEAREQYQESIKTDRENPGAHFNLANMLVDHYRDYDTAQFHFEKAIALEPMYSLYRMTYAEFLWHDCDRYKESALQYRELIKFNSDNEDIFFNYGLLLRDHLKDISKAVQMFEKVMALNPNDSEALEEYNYALSLRKIQSTKSDKTHVLSVDDSEEKSDKVVFNLDLCNDGQSSGVSEARETRSQYHSERKKNSAFRKSVHEINVNGLNDEEDYALKYHEIMDEKNRLTLILREKQRRMSAQNASLMKIKGILSENSEFKKELAMMVRNGANYVEVNAKNAHKLLSICHNIIGQLDGMNISKDDDGNTTPIVRGKYNCNNGHKKEPSVV